MTPEVWASESKRILGLRSRVRCGTCTCGTPALRLAVADVAVGFKIWSSMFCGSELGVRVEESWRGICILGFGIWLTVFGFAVYMGLVASSLTFLFLLCG